jgi:hypothetical protein
MVECDYRWPAVAFPAWWLFAGSVPARVVCLGFHRVRCSSSGSRSVWVSHSSSVSVATGFRRVGSGATGAKRPSSKPPLVTDLDLKLHRRWAEFRTRLQNQLAAAPH